MRKSRYFYPVLLLLLSELVSLVGMGLKLGHAMGWEILLTMGILSQFVGVVWFLVALLKVTHRQVN